MEKSIKLLMRSDLLNEIRAYSNEEVKKKIIRQCSKKWYDNNKKYKKQKNKEWCENNKEYYQQYYKKLNEKVICKFCNSASSKHNLKRHQESKKCLKIQDDLKDIKNK